MQTVPKLADSHRKSPRAPHLPHGRRATTFHRPEKKTAIRGNKSAAWVYYL